MSVSLLLSLSQLIQFRKLGSSPEKPNKYSSSVQRLFKSRLGIVIDRQCRDVKRLRFATFDAEPYINPNADVFRIIDMANNPVPNTKTANPALTPRAWKDNMETTVEKVAQLTAEVVRQGIDLTDGYSNWVEIGMALADLGEAGREFFHAVSSVYPDYDQAKADTKFTNLLRTTRKVTIGTFFHQCDAHGASLDTNA